ncbi:DUF1493 family protein [Leclercia sp. G3L]|nr:DUF1493 family protein [Leclercia sp. G3L]
MFIQSAKAGRWLYE